MITHWPSIGNTETLYSVASRLHYLGGGSSAPRTSQWLFGFDTAASQRFSPRHLDHFCAVVDGRLGSADRILKNRTPVGQFAPFVTAATWNRWVGWCRSLPAAHKPFLALRNFDVPSRTPLRACPGCMAADQNALGSATWRLEHQLLGSRTCIWHDHILLEEVPTLRRAGEFANAWLRPEDCLGQDRLRPCVVDSRTIQYWSNVSKVAWALAVYPFVTGDRLRTVVRTELAQAGVVCSGKRIGVEGLARWWTALDRPSFLESRSLASLEDSRWIHQTLLGRRHDHPLKWSILSASVMTPDALVRALAAMPQEQLTLEGEWDPSVTTREDLLSAEVWDLLASGISIVEVSARAGIPAPRLRHALRLNPGRQRARNRRISDLSWDMRREIVSSFLLENPDAKRADLLRAHSAELRWLEEHDATWITQMLGDRWTARFRQRAFDF